MRILVVEDDLGSRMLVVKHLERWNYSVISADDGEIAWNLFQSDPEIRMVILDWMMPRVSGIDLCERIRAFEDQNQRKRAYVLFLTGKTEKADLVKALKAGADDYVTKPFNQGELQARVEVGNKLIDLEDKLASRIVELELALTHVKKLQGLLPICAYCKRIRDSSDYWHQVEAYIAQHSDVMFTHSICPECMKKHFPHLPYPKKAKTE